MDNWYNVYECWGLEAEIEVGSWLDYNGLRQKWVEEEGKEY